MRCVLVNCIDLFAGPGGLGEGFHKAGFQIAISIEKEAVECETLRRRKLHHLMVKNGFEETALELALNSVNISNIR